jgi:hypothetical protein
MRNLLEQGHDPFTMPSRQLAAVGVRRGLGRAARAILLPSAMVTRVVKANTRTNGVSVLDHLPLNGHR